METAMAMETAMQTAITMAKETTAREMAAGTEAKEDIDRKSLPVIV